MNCKSEILTLSIDNLNCSSWVCLCVQGFALIHLNSKFRTHNFNVPFKVVPYTLQGDNSLKSVEGFDHMIFVCRFQASQ